MLEWSLAHRAADARHRRASPSPPRSFLYPYVGKELVPDDDQSEFSVNLRLPRGTSFDRTLEYMTPIEGELRKALGDNLAVDDDLDPERQRQLLGPADADRRSASSRSSS